VHDADEAYAGDTPTLRITAEGRRAKVAREHAAAARIQAEFARRLPWFPETIRLYEELDLPEARFVRGLDKLLPKIVHLLDGGVGLARHGMFRPELDAVYEQQAIDMAAYVGDFPELMRLREELVDRVLAQAGCLADAEAAPAAEPVARR
jgi:hypothetical protein